MDTHVIRLESRNHDATEKRWNSFGWFVYAAGTGEADRAADQIRKHTGLPIRPGRTG